ncbi:MAG TPA: hypothetical protein VFL17_11805 [Anaerolineae bacterium]|nr:hypothetical protein [Anaerolineae bacterium]
MQISIETDKDTLRPGECATLEWEVVGGFGVELNGQPVERSGQKQVCPAETMTYLLSMDTGVSIERRAVEIVVAGGGPPPEPTLPSAAAPPSGFDPTTLKPFTAGELYLGQYETGLYPGASNAMLEAHGVAGEQIAATIRPLDTSGQPDDQQGRILALVMGHSNAHMYFEAFRAHLSERAAELNPRFEMLNAAVGGNQLPEIAQLQGDVWNWAQELTTQPGYSSLQVQVLFLHTTYHGCCNDAGLPPGEFPASMQAMQRDLAKVLGYAIQVYPNIKIAYLTSDGFRHFRGFEPHVWREAFAFKWLIESQIEGEPGTVYTGENRQMPWLEWGPYIWDNTWDESYFTDGVHPSPKALAIFVQKYWGHLSQDSVARPWLFKSGSNR